MEIGASYDVEDFDFSVIVPEIRGSYWGQGRERTDIMRAFQVSYVVGLFARGHGQIAWARATSDTVFHAYIFDAVVLKSYRGCGLGKRVITELMEHPDLRRVDEWMLSTKDAHDFYRKFGFAQAEGDRLMKLSKETVLEC